VSDAMFHEFMLTDADGAVHRYEVLPHPASEGQAVLLQLLAVAAEPVGRLASSVFEGAGTVGELLDSEPAKLMERVDLGRLGADVKTAILSMQMDKLGADVLRHTMRDGKKLSDRVAFDAAFTRNYFEYLRAVWEVVQINRFLPLSAISGLVKGRA
jgi:hypothetical protein